MYNFNEEDEYETVANLTFIDAYTEKLIPYLKVEKVFTCKNCENAIKNRKECTKREGCINFSNYKNKTGALNGNSDYGWYKQIILSDGMWLFPEQASRSANGSKFIFVDINGYSAGPNRQGYDLFAFQIAEDGTLMLDTFWGSECKLTNMYSGFDCTRQAISNPDYFKKLVY